METIKADDVKPGVGLNTWFGKHTVVALLPYTGPFDFILNIMRFSNGTEMSNEANAIYEIA